MSNPSIGKLCFYVRARLYPSRSDSKREYRNYDAEGDGIGRHSVVKFALPSHTIVARKTRCYNIRIRTCGVKGEMDRSRLARIHSGKSIRRSRDRCSLEVETPGSRSKVIIISRKRNRGTKFFFRATLQRTRSSYAV